nr:MAG TPA: hypothetical protein [Caudoviricetes sp.]
MNNNIFYLLKGEQQTAVSGRYDTKTGDYESTSEIGHYCLSTRLTDLKPSKRLDAEIVVMLAPDINFTSATVLYYDKNSEYLGFTALDIEELNSGNLSELINQQGLDRVYQIALDFSLNISETELSQMTQAEINSMLFHVWVYAGFKLQEPHYNKLESKYKKETGQVFFRNSLEGSVKIFGIDFDFINSQSLETKYLLLVADTNSKLVSLNSFAKTDCKLDNIKRSIELKLSSIDRYSKLMDKYDNTYDLIKLSPAITPLTLTKRLLYQFYIQGANSVSCYANGTYWEQDVNEAIDDAKALEKKYYFAKNFTKQEIIIEKEQSEHFAGTYMRDESYNGYKWVHTTKSNLVFWLDPLSDSEKANYATQAWGYGTILNAATGKHPTNTTGENRNSLYWIRFNDTKIFGSLNTPNLRSKSVYCTSYADKKFGGVFNSESGADYSLKKELDNTDAFNLRDCLIDYTIWGRILADVDTALEVSSGQTKTLYDLPKDDFVSERVNYRKCIGLVGLQVKQTSYTVTHPTKYGRNDAGKYFTNNFVNAVTKTEHMPIPISRSSWANTSIWAIIPDNWSLFESQFRKQFILKDTFSLADVIKSLLHKIDPLIKFEATAEYSQFLYGGDTSTPIIPFDGSRVGYVPYIAPKSNVLKGNYDQAAQKAEITFEQVMNMLRDCFRCYWFIDDDNRLRIEHISYFMKGLSYTSPNIQLDLTKKYDKFNKKTVLYAQEATSYNKDDLSSRYEFNWMDDSTDTFDDMEIDVNSVYIQSDKTEEINSEVFSTDIDLMLYAPDKFSSDGFALMMADKSTGRVPIAAVSGLRDNEYVYTYRVTPQNYLCSWLYLARYYMLDMPAYHIDYTRAPSSDAYRVTGIKQFKQQDIEFQTDEKIDLNKAIKTSVGTGIIDSLSMNIDTKLISVTLVYSPQ